MKTLVAFFLIFCASVSGAQSLSEYRLGSGDVLSINVFGEQNLSFEDIIVSDAGTIIYPFLGELEVGGLAIGEMSDMLTEQLLDGWLISPSVNVRVIKYRDFYIRGEVNSPGGYAYQPGITLQQAVALAGGFTERASNNKFEVQSEGADDNVRAEIDSAISPGDTIIIEESFF